MASKKRVLGSATLKRQHVIGGPKKPSEFLMNDRHGDVLSDTEFKSLWWHIQETMTLTNDTTRNSRMVMSIIQNCAAYRVLHVKQVMSIAKLFDSVADRLEILEFFVQRCHKLQYKSDLIPLFIPSLRPYVATILDRTMLVEPTEGIPMHALLFRNKLVKSKKIVRGIKSALERVQYNRTNQNEVVLALLNKDARPMSHRQAFKILHRFVDDCETMLSVIALLDRFVVGFTCREVALLINDISTSNYRYEVLRKLSPFILDSEHRWITLDVGFGNDRADMREKVAQHLQTWTIRPRSFLFGTIIGKCVCFIVDTSSSMKCTFVTNQGERVSRMRFVAKELSIVLRHQLDSNVRFNIVAFDKIPIVFSEGGPMEASTLNVLNACNWLRLLQPTGPTNTTAALELAFKSTGKSMDEVYLVIDGDPSNGIDHEMKLFETTIKPYMAKMNVKPRINVTAIVLGSHPADDVKKTEDYAYDLATEGGGLCRFLVDDSYQPNKGTTTFIVQERKLLNKCSGIGWQILYAISFLFLCFTAYFTQHFTRITGRRTYLDIATMIPTFLNPDPSVFRFWIVALSLQGIMVLQMLRIPLCCTSKKTGTDDPYAKNTDDEEEDEGVDDDDEEEEDNDLKGIKKPLEKDATIILLGQMEMLTWRLALLFITTSFWLLSLQAEILLLASMFGFLHLILLCLLHKSLEIGKHPMYYATLQEQANSNSSHNTMRNGILWSERLFLNVPVSANLAWTSYLVCLQVAQYMQSWEWFGFGWSEEWALFFILILGILGIVMATVFSDSVYAMVMAYCMAGIAQNNFREARSAGDVQKIDDISDFSYGFMMYVASLTMGVLLFVFSLRPVAAGYSELLYKTLFAKKRDSTIIDANEKDKIMSECKASANYTWKQLFSLCVWFIMILINLFTTEYFNTIAGVDGTPLINHETFTSITRKADFPNDDVGQYRYVLRVMPADFFWYLFYVVYTMFFMFIALQLLPAEKFGRHVTRLKEEDKALDKKVFIRGSKSKWKKICGCCNIPMINKWRATPRASNVLVDKSHNMFVAVCLFNMLFLVCFLHREYLVSLIMLLLLFITLILWYIRVHAWYVIVQPKTDDEIIELKEEFDKAHAEEAPELREEKWNHKETILRKKPLDISFVETIVLHVPISAYLGLVSFVVIFIGAYFTLLFVGIGPGQNTDINGVVTGEPGWNMADWYDEGWAWAMVALVSLVIIGISGKNQDPILPLAFSAGPAGMFYQNTVGTCTWSTTSGISIRKPDSENPNQQIKSKQPLAGLPELYQRGGVSGGRLHWFWNLTDDTGEPVNDYIWVYKPPVDDTATTGTAAAAATTTTTTTMTATDTDDTDDTDDMDDRKTRAPYWCKKAVEQGHNNYYPPTSNEVAGKPWAFRYQDGGPLTYYDETRNKDGDYVYLQGRCRRIYKDAKGLPVTAADECGLLGTQRTGNPDVVRGFYWMDDLCVEDSGTCNFIYGKTPGTSHTPEYVLATATFWITCILWLASLGIFKLRYGAYKARQAKHTSRANIFSVDDM